MGRDTHYGLIEFLECRRLLAATPLPAGVQPPVDARGAEVALGPILSGQRLRGHFKLGEEYSYDFSADAGDRLLALLARSGGAGVQPELEIRQPGGAVLASGANPNAVVLSAQAPVTGTYTLIVRETGGDGGGAYGLSLAVSPGASVQDPRDPDGAIVQTVSRYGALTVGDADIWPFLVGSGPFGVRVREVAGTAIEPSLIVVAPDGTQFTSTGDAQASVSGFSAIAGTYYAIVYDAGGDETGGYSIAGNGEDPSAFDVVAPVALQGDFDALHTGNLEVTFSEAVTNVSAADLSIKNLTSGATPAANSVTFDSDENIASFGVAGGLADGNYYATLMQGSTEDASGNDLGNPVNFSFFVLAGDANRDRAVNIGDFAVLAANFNQPGTFGDGDFDYSGTVNISDFAILASKFNTNLPPAPLLRYGFDEPVGDAANLANPGTHSGIFNSAGVSRSSDTPGDAPGNSMFSNGTDGGAGVGAYAQADGIAQTDPLDSIRRDGAFTLSAWVKVSTIAASDVILSNQEASNTLAGITWQFQNVNTSTPVSPSAFTLQLTARTSTGSEFLSGRSAAIDSTTAGAPQWMFVAATFSGSQLGGADNRNVHFFLGTETSPVVPLDLNGGTWFGEATAVASDDGINFLASGNSMRIGSNPRTNLRTPNAFFDDVRIYAADALTLSQLDAIRQENLSTAEQRFSTQLSQSAQAPSRAWAFSTTRVISLLENAAD